MARSCQPTRGRRLPSAGRRLLVLGSLAISCGAPAGATAADGACPSATVHFDRYTLSPPFPVEAVAYDSTFGTTATARIAFDRRSGHVFLSAGGGGRLSAGVRVVERFDLTGVAPGTRLDATLTFTLEGMSQQACGGAGCGVELLGTLVVGADSVSADANQGGPSYTTRLLDGTLSLPVQFVAGTPTSAQFFLSYGTGPGQNGASGEVTGTYAVSGLPPGVRAVACPGDDVTPARRASWGRLRTLYR